jgi:phosphatidylglycerophosphatase A
MKNFKDILIDQLASGFRSGYAPIASGTFGTLVAIPFVVLLKLYVTEITFAITTVILIVVSCYIAHKGEELYQEPDSSKIVIDEVAGYFVTCLFMTELRWDVFAAAFFIFRFFDIVKLWPASYCDKKKGGTWVVLDDVAAGVYSRIALQLYIYLAGIALVYLNVGKSGV